MPRVADDERHARREITERGVPLAPDAVLEKFHAVVGIHHHHRVVRKAGVLEMREQQPHLVVELGHATVVEMQDLLEVELFARLGLAPNDVERVGEPRHREFRFRKRTLVPTGVWAITPMPAWANLISSQRQCVRRTPPMHS